MLGMMLSAGLRALLAELDGRPVVCRTRRVMWGQVRIQVYSPFDTVWQVDAKPEPLHTHNAETAHELLREAFRLLLCSSSSRESPHRSQRRAALLPAATVRA